MAKQHVAAVVPEWSAMATDFHAVYLDIEMGPSSADFQWQAPMQKCDDRAYDIDWLSAPLNLKLGRIPPQDP